MGKRLWKWLMEVIMVMVKLSKEPYISIPEELGRKLHLKDGEKVSIDIKDDTVILQRFESKQKTGYLIDLIGIIKSSRPDKEPVEIEKYLEKRGYEQLYRGKENI